MFQVLIQKEHGDPAQSLDHLATGERSLCDPPPLCMTRMALCRFDHVRGFTIAQLVADEHLNEAKNGALIMKKQNLVVFLCCLCGLQLRFS